jgi:transcriptional regulator with XRE-family HTH domain
MTIPDSFASWLQEELRQRGWNQAELARRSGITTAQVSRLLTGEQHPGPTACRKIARALHIPAEEIFRKAGLLPPQRQQPEGADELLHLYTDMDDAERARLLTIARALHGMGRDEG